MLRQRYNYEFSGVLYYTILFDLLVENSSKCLIVHKIENRRPSKRPKKYSFHLPSRAEQCVDWSAKKKQRNY